MDRVFLDANILFSASHGSARISRLWDMAAAGACRLLSCPRAVGEARRNLRTEAQDLLTARLRSVGLVPDAPPGERCPVPLPEADGAILLAAIRVPASHFLTGNHRDFATLYRTRVAGVLVLPPAEYLAG